MVIEYTTEYFFILRMQILKNISKKGSFLQVNPIKLLKSLYPLHVQKHALGKIIGSR
jgi:hypothetical protein